MIQNQIEWTKWRFTYVDLAKSIETGKQEVLKSIDIERDDELEGFAFLNNSSKGIGVTSSKNDNVSMMNINW